MDFFLDDFEASYTANLDLASLKELASQLLLKECLLLDMPAPLLDRYWRQVTATNERIARIFQDN